MSAFPKTLFADPTNHSPLISWAIICYFVFIILCMKCYDFFTIFSKLLILYLYYVFQ